MEVARPSVRSDIYCQEIKGGYTRCDSVENDLLEHAIICSRSLMNFTTCNYEDDILTLVVLRYQVRQIPFINKTTLVQILGDSPNNVFKDMAYSCGLSGHHTFAKNEEVVGDFTDSMSVRVLACMVAKGGFTTY
ncbi:hypothetical protein TNCV_401861 [Trichonephila clavipes]|nr:hypothetical protein TNCV_401861 [Trichonephila clavipes]